MKKKDIYLISAVIIVAVIIYAVIANIRSTSGNLLQVTVDGELFGEYLLSENQTIEIETDLGTNILVIENGHAYMKEADCPDGYCIEQGEISNNSETIVCLPHKVVAEVIISDQTETDSENEVDIIQQ